MDSTGRKKYVDGVRMGSFALAVFSLSCTILSMFMNFAIMKIGKRCHFTFQKSILAIDSICCLYCFDYRAPSNASYLVVVG